MPFGDIKQNDNLDLDELFKNIIVPDTNMYIADKEKAIELISELIKNKANISISFQKKIENKINNLFSLFSEVTIEGKMSLYERFMELCSHFSEWHKIKKIQNKAVISFGGKVSAGKSMFINTISGIGNKLPVNQKTTTAIPTYIIKSKTDEIHANSLYGYSSEISSEALNAMAHEFDYVYGIGFSAFVDSIIIESKEYELDDEIALLDTPGYTKYDKKSDSKKENSDQQKAREQLSASDYLIWLIDIDSGTITEDDIQFIESLLIKTPILIVFTKADLKSDKEIEQIINGAKKTIAKTSIGCFGITAYSAKEKKEYGNNKIEQFFDSTIKCKTQNNDIFVEFDDVEKDMKDAIEDALEQSVNTSEKLLSYISNSDKFIDINSLSTLWGKANKDANKLNNILNLYDEIISGINEDIKRHFKEGEGV